MRFSRIRFPHPGLDKALLLAALVAFSSAAASARAVQPGDLVGGDATWCQPWIRSETTGPSLVSAYDPRPPDGTYIQSSTHFRVHYEDMGLDAYAALALQSAEDAYSALVGVLGYVPPPSDDPNGGDGRTDFYILPSGSVSYAGRTVPEAAKQNGPYLNAWTSYAEIVDSMSATILPLIVVHEYFHVIQVGYDKDENISLLEMLSVWSEDYLYDGVNRYLRYLPTFFIQPQVPLMNWKYSNVVWAKFLSENFGDEIIGDILDRCGMVILDNAVSAMDDELVSLGSGLSDQFARFTLWNYFTGPRNDGFHYKEAGTYPSVKIERDTECLPLMSYAPALKPGALASNYYLFLGDRSNDSLAFDFLLSPGSEWIISMNAFIDGLVNTATYHYPAAGDWNSHEIALDAWGEYDSLLVIANNVNRTGASFYYYIAAGHAPAPPPELPYILVFDRDDCVRPFDGVNDAFTTADGEAYPYAVALGDKTVRCFLTDSLPGDLSLCGAIIVIGGFDGGGCNLSAAELQTLMDFMDAGGDLYLESTLLGSWIDPSQGSPSPAEEAFWGYFGCGFEPGNPMSTGNVETWRTTADAPVPLQRFAYDYRSDPDDLVGVLVPEPGTDTLIVDQAGIVRGTVAHGANESDRICATVMLGGSMPGDGESTREDYIRNILNMFDTIVPALAVVRFDYRLLSGSVSFDGEVEGLSGQRLVLRREELPERLSSVEVPLDVSLYGTRARVGAVDDPRPGRYLYSLLAVNTESERALWQRTISIDESVPDLSAASISPNPSNGNFRILISAVQPAAASISLFDASGRRIRAEHVLLSKGSNAVLWPGTAESGDPIPAGVYFLRIASGPRSVTRKIVVLR